MSNWPVSKIPMSTLDSFCGEIELLIKTSPSLFIQNKLADRSSMVQNEEKYGLLKKLLDSIRDVAYARMIHDEIPVEETLRLFVGVTAGKVVLTPESPLPSLLIPWPPPEEAKAAAA